MTTKIDKLTPEQEKLLPVYRDEWLAVGLNTQPADRPRAEKGVIDLCKALDKPVPTTMIWVKSPLMGALVAAVLSEIGNQ